jgi:aspartyl-tRNA(Asn)/glutamyl-tRNA(Gln) amidotransferase subunit A
MGALAVGTDGGGSIRIPCSFTGLFGLKPSFGRVPAWPLSPFGTVAHVGPMARSVTDAALMLNVLAQPDARDWHALPYDGTDWRSDLNKGVRDLRIAYSPDLGYADVDAEVAAIVRKAVDVFTDLGAKVEEKHPGFENPDAIFRVHWFTGAAALIKGIPAEKRNLIDPGLLEVAEDGAKITSAELMDAQMKRGALGTHMNLFHRDYDLLVTPTLAVAAFDAGQEFPPGKSRWIDWTPFSFPFNLTQQPAASIPCGLTKAGLPVGLHIVGPRYADRLVLRAARAFETARPIVMPDVSQLKKT